MSIIIYQINIFYISNFLSLEKLFLLVSLLYHTKQKNSKNIGLRNYLLNLYRILLKNIKVLTY